MAKKASDTLDKIGHPKKKAFLAAYAKSLGNVTEACKKAGVPRSTYYSWINSDKEFASQINDIGEEVLDYTEGKLMGLVRSGDKQAIFFLLNNKGKTRGYNSVIKVEHSGTPTFVIEMDKEDKENLDKI